MFKKKYMLPFLCAIILVVASLACGKSGDPTKEAPIDVEPTQAMATEAPAEDPVEDPTDVPEVEPTEEPAEEEPTEAPPEIDVPFPLPDDARNVMEMSGVVNFQTDLSLEEVAEFYRQEITAMGYVEYEATTVISEKTVNLVFNDPAGGESIVVQSIPLDDATNVSIRYEDI
jgi:hypothetical protein